MTSVLFTRVSDEVKAAADTRATAKGFSRTAHWMRELLCRELGIDGTGKPLPPMDPRQLELAAHVGKLYRDLPHPPAPPQGGERPRAVPEPDQIRATHKHLRKQLKQLRKKLKSSAHVPAVSKTRAKNIARRKRSDRKQK